MQVYISTGSNLGDRTKALVEALEQLNLAAGPVMEYSSVYETEPWGFKTDLLFLNQVIRLDTELQPASLMKVLLSIESAMGRERTGEGYSSRSIDLDILFYGDRVINEGELTVPHPRLHLRRFVLEPLAELNPLLEHPLLMKNVGQLLMECKDEGTVRKFMDRSEFRDVINHPGIHD